MPSANHAPVDDDSHRTSLCTEIWMHLHQRRPRTGARGSKSWGLVLFGGLEVVELGGDAELGGAPEDGIDVLVDPLDDLARRRRAGVDRCAYLVEPLGAMVEVVVDDRTRIVDHRRVPRQDAGDEACLDQVTDVRELVEVGPEHAVGMSDHGRAAAQDRVAAQQ